MSVLDPTEAGGRSPVPLVDIDEIEPDESLVADLRKTRITTPVTRVLLVLIVLSVGFLGGALVDRHERPSSSASSTLASLATRFGRGRGAAGGSGAAAGGSGAAGGGFGGFGGVGGAAAAGVTVGTVKLVDGSKVYVQDTAGDDIEVTTNPSTQITISSPGKVSQLAPGTTVIVQGKASSDGTSVAATSITPSTGLAGLGGGGRFGGGGAAAGG